MQCLTSSAYGRVHLQIPPIHGQQACVTVHVPPVWTCYIIQGIFTKHNRPVVQLLWGICLHVYLHDWLNQVESPSQASFHMQLVIAVLQGGGGGGGGVTTIKRDGGHPAQGCFHGRMGCTSRRGQFALFLHWNPEIRNITDIRRSYISNWIFRVVKAACINADQHITHMVTEQECQLSCGARWHHFSCFWRLAVVFQNYHLRDMSSISNRMAT